MELTSECHCLPATFSDMDLARSAANGKACISHACFKPYTTHTTLTLPLATRMRETRNIFVSPSRWLTSPDGHNHICLLIDLVLQSGGFCSAALYICQHGLSPLMSDRSNSSGTRACPPHYTAAVCLWLLNFPLFRNEAITGWESRSFALRSTGSPAKQVR